VTAAPYLTAAAAKTRDSRLSTRSDAVIESGIAAFEPIIEAARGVAFTPRAVTVTTDVDWPTRDLFLDHHQVSAITSVTVNGTAIDASTYRLRGAEGILRLKSGCWTTDVDIVIAYTHGYAEPPELVLQAATEYVDSVVRSHASGTPRDVIAQSFEGGITRFGTPDWAAGRFTGWNEVDRLIRSVPDERPIGGWA